MKTGHIGQSNRISGADSDMLNPASLPDAVREGTAGEQEHETPPSFEEWLNDYLECPKGNYRRIYHCELRARDRQLWDGPIPQKALDSGFTSDDVLLLRAGGQVTTREEWDDVLEAMYRHQWQCSLALWAAYQPAPRMEQEALQQALLERC
jgi:hypothetical protein